MRKLNIRAPRPTTRGYYTAFHITGVRETCFASAISYSTRIRKLSDPASALCRSYLTRLCSMQCSIYGGNIGKGYPGSCLARRPCVGYELVPFSNIAPILAAIFNNSRCGYDVMLASYT